MIPGLKEHFDEIWVVDFEFSAPLGENPEAACLVAKEFFSGKLFRMSAEEFKLQPAAPFPVCQRTLVVAFFSSAEWGCFLELGWPLPKRILDLYVEFKNMFNGRETLAGFSLLGALAQFGLSSIDAAEKEDMRQLAKRGGPFTQTEMSGLLDYCQSDVDATERLFTKMCCGIDLPRALLRGRYTVAVAVMEHNGIPVDHAQLQQLRGNWDGIREELVSHIDRQYNVFEGLSFREAKFRAWLKRENIPWPTHENGKLKLDQDTFRQQAKKFPRVGTLQQLRQDLSDLRLEKLAVGSDGRNRCLLSPFSSRTSRNQPSTNKFIFGSSSWLRSLIKPPPGKAIAYIDWSMQELGIGAALSGDENMLAAYDSGDPYLALAKFVNAVPDWATKKSHPDERAMYKICSLGVQYGMSEYGLALALNVPLVIARCLLRRHKEAYPTFWKWSRANVDCAMLKGKIQTVFGWTLHIAGKTKARTIANFPCQANGAEMMRLACSLTTEAGIKVCCPVHDAILIEANVDEIEIEVERTKRLMAEASREVLDGFELRTDAEVVRYPDRYRDGRGQRMWEKVVQLSNSLDRSEGIRSGTVV